MALSEPEVRGLVEAHRAGDEAAFARIAHVHYEELLGHAVRLLGQHEAAEDAVQEAFVRAYRGLPAFNGEYRLRAWLHRILRNVCIDEIGRRSREARLLERAAALEPRATGAEPDAVEQEEARQAVEAALATLPAPYRNALVLRYAEELSFRDVAAATGVSEDNARARVHRGRTALRRLLSGPAVLVVWIAQLGRRGERSAVEAVMAAGVEPVSLVSTTSHASSFAGQKAAMVAGIMGLVASAGVPVATNTFRGPVESPAGEVVAAAPPAPVTPASLPATPEEAPPPDATEPSADDVDLSTTTVATNTTTTSTSVPEQEALDGPAPETLAPPAPRVLEFASETLSAEDEGWRILVYGVANLHADGDDHEGWLSIELVANGEPDADGARSYVGTFYFERRDGRWLRASIELTLSDAESRAGTGRFRITGGERFGMPRQGEIDFELAQVDGDGDSDGYAITVQLREPEPIDEPADEPSEDAGDG